MTYKVACTGINECCNRNMYLIAKRGKVGDMDNLVVNFILDFTSKIA